MRSESAKRVAPSSLESSPGSPDLQQPRQDGAAQEEIDELKRRLEAQNGALQELRAMTRGNADGVLLVDHAGNVLSANPAAGVVLGRQRENLVGQVFGFPIAGGKRAELDIPRGDAPPRVVEMLVSEMSMQNRDERYVVSLRDITQLAQLRDHMRTLSLTDELTGLYNRRGWSVLVQQQLLLAKRVHVPVMLLYADLDGLKSINDSFGHGTGDEAIVGCADVLKASFRESDLIARMGGDEFAVLPISARDSSEQVIRDRLESKLMDWNASAEREYKLSASIGIVYWDPESGQTLDDVISSADKLMYEQKGRAKVKENDESSADWGMRNEEKE